MNCLHFYKNQNYNQLKLIHNKDNLFKDSLFPPINSSIFSRKLVPYGISWMRPHEAMLNPQFVINGFELYDLNQGSLTNCWYNIKLQSS
jgi:hypothetical protein